jgi:hypothetical protein
MNLKYFFGVLIFVMLNHYKIKAQNSCPPNIGFENGTFSGWSTFSGKVVVTSLKNNIQVSPSLPISNRHTILSTSSNAVDNYGKFTLKPQNNSKYIVKLGNDGTGALAERISYTFKVPNDDNFSIKYRYAVVFQDPNHPEYQQPRFTAKVFDLSTNKYIECASFEYIATANLPGFQVTTVSNTKVYYKSWTPVSINLSKYKGKNIRLEFSTADCTQTGHFGYAYLDIDEECSNLIKGNTFCNNANGLTLTGPDGYSNYLWFNKNFTKSYGTGNPLKTNENFDDNADIALVVVPYPGFGCQDTIFTKIKKAGIILNVNNQTTCFPDFVNLKDTIVTSGSSDNITLSYWVDSLATIPLINADKITASGKFFIKASNSEGCEITKAVIVTILPFPNFLVKPSLKTCFPFKVDLTSPEIVKGSSINDLTFTYWKDIYASLPIDSPDLIDSTGRYFIKATTSFGCELIKPLDVEIALFPKFLVVNSINICFSDVLDLTTPDIVKGSAMSELTFNYWKDALATIAITNPKTINQSGDYYIKATNTFGCFEIKPIKVIINPLPILTITNPSEVCFPETIDLTLSKTTTGSDRNATLSYWTNSSCTTALANPNKIIVSGTYYIKAKLNTGCETVKPVIVKINPLSVFKVLNQTEVCEPSSIDLTTPDVVKGSAMSELTFSYWKDALATIAITNPKTINQSGDYYIKATNTFGCFEIKPVKVIINPLPVLTITNPSEVCFPETIDLTLSKITTGSDRNASLSYWTNSSCTIALTNPNKIGVSGTYYIKAKLNTDCETIKPVIVKINPLSVFKVLNQIEVCEPSTIDLTALDIVKGSAISELIFSYWKDPLATVSVANPKTINQSGDYYIKATNSFGCFEIKPVKVIINPLPILTITNPSEVCFPETIDLTLSKITAGSDRNATLSYWTNSSFTTALTNPSKVAVSGTYYIKAKLNTGCETVKPVIVKINPLPYLNIKDSKPVYEPNTVDITSSQLIQFEPNTTITYWNDENFFSKLNQPDKIDKTGYYYIKVTNALGCVSVGKIYVLIALQPKILVPSGFTPTQIKNNRLYPLVYGVKQITMFKIYNKWGTLVFDNPIMNYEDGWDGNFNGQMNFYDTYTWYVEGIDQLGNKVRKSGNTILLK